MKSCPDKAVPHVAKLCGKMSQIDERVASFAAKGFCALYVQYHLGCYFRHCAILRSIFFNFQSQ